MKITSQMYLQSVNKVFLWFGLVTYFLTLWPCFKLELEIIKTNILSKIHDDNYKTWESMVLNRSSVCWVFFDMNLKVIIENCPMDR